MKAMKKEYLSAVLFSGFLAAMLIGYALLPKADFSENEKRYLAEPPKMNWEAVSSGKWGSEVETYLADHMPGRDFFVGLNAYFDLITGRQNAGSVRVFGDRLLEAPAVLSEGGLEKNLNAIQTFSEAAKQQVALMIVPSAGWAAGAKDYADDAILDTIYAKAEGIAETFDLRPVFRGKPELFYKTDHHWTSGGAYEACRTYMERIGRDYPSADAFEIETVPDFHGSTYSRSALWLTPGEDIELWHGTNDITVVNGEAKEPHDGVFYRERLSEADKYTVFLDGNHSVVRITNPAGTGKLLVIRDSYSNSLGCFLAESWAEVVLVDLRYYKSPVSALAKQEDFDQILICYSIGNFLTDANIVWLR